MADARPDEGIPVSGAAVVELKDEVEYRRCLGGDLT